MMVSIAVLAIIIVVLLTILDRVSNSFRYVNAKVEEFGQAHAAFESLTERLSQATLDPYWDYNSLTSPTGYIRQSELRFICGSGLAIIDNGSSTAHTEKHYTSCAFFQAPLGLVSNTGSDGQLKNLLNTCGYCVEYGSNAIFLPGFIGVANATTRFRLIEQTEPAESLQIYQYTSGLDKNSNPATLDYFTNLATYPLTGLSTASQFTGTLTTVGASTGKEWFMNTFYTNGSSHVSGDSIHILADNVLALVLLPKLSADKDPTSTALAPNYCYDSTSTFTSSSYISGQTAANVNITSGDLSEANELPPIVQVTMVAIDEASARRLNANATNLAKVQTDLTTTYPFTSAANYQSDLAGLQADLAKMKINYRIFTSDVYLKEAKWSRN